MPGRNLFLISIIIAFAFLNFLGALSPELGFDALWYHLTIPKLYLLNGSIFHIPGGLLYYSEMPRLSEMIYLPLIKFFSDTGPHLLSWLAGIGTTIVTYKLARKFLSRGFSLLAAGIWYVTPLVGWLSGSAYIDLIRTFFEVLALYLVFDNKILTGGLAAGLAIGTKTLAWGSLPLLSLVNFALYRNIKNTLKLIVVSVMVSLPWFLGAYLTTGYLFYPIGSGVLSSLHSLNFNIFSLPSLMGDFWRLSLIPEDPITPLFLILLPFFFISLKKLDKKLAYLALYTFLSYLVWYITPRTGGGRFFFPYVPAFAVLTAWTISVQRVNIIRSSLILVAILTLGINFIYRLGASRRLLPFLLNRETKTQYLCQNLEFSTGVFADCDGWFARNIKPADLVYVAGVHNLYYIDFPYVHETWYRGESFNYLLTQNETLDQIKDNKPGIIGSEIKEGKWKMIYENNMTGVRVYTRS